MKILVIPGLTLPEVSAETLVDIEKKAGPGSEVVVSKQDEAIGYVGDADVVLGFVSKDMFRASNKLRWVHAISSGVDMFLYDEFVRSDVVLTSEKGLVGEHLADTGFGLLLSLTRQIARAIRYGADGWNHRPEMRFQEVELTGLTMGVFGFGGTGRAMAKRAKAFGMKVIAIDREDVGNSPEVDRVMESSEFRSFLEQSDVVSICCPLTKETRGKFDAKAFAVMKDSAFLVNVTRGEVMSEADLVFALENGAIQGAGLDVVPREPLPSDSKLWALDNVVMTPHTAGASPYRAQRNIERFLTNLERMRRGEELEGVIDKELGY